MESLPKAFDALRNYPQFILYKLVAKPGATGKFDKIPVHSKTYQPHNPLDPNNWLTADDALAKVRSLGNSQSGFFVGFTFTASDPFFFVDIDNAYDSVRNEWSQLSRDLLAQFPHAAIEVSSSNRGLHIIGTSQALQHVCKDRLGLGLELYTQDRFVALTGYHARGSVDADCSVPLQSLVSQYFTPVPTTHVTVNQVSDWSDSIADEDLIAKALGTKGATSVFGGNERATFAELWNGDTDALCRAFPKDGSYDRSDADAALAQHLAFWTANNEERMQRLMRQSGLYREKYDRPDYLPRTIAFACKNQLRVGKYYDGGGRTEGEGSNVAASVSTQTPPVTQHDTTNITKEVTPAHNIGLQSVEQQLQIFAGCAYIADENKILIPGGTLLKESAFNVVYGGMRFPLRVTNDKLSKNAFEAFTQSEIIPCRMAMTTCFKPDLTPGEIILINGMTAVNVYSPPRITMIKGDVAPFLNHLAKLLPNETDRAILLNYMAAIVQLKGVKFQWCPIIQGTQGNGKTLLTLLLSHMVGRHYTHFPKASELANKFNGWLDRKILIGVEDIFVSRDKMEIIEALKPMITGEAQGIERKGKEQVTYEIVANFILNTNHPDAVRQTEEDRRFATFYTAQQSVDDLRRDGMTGDYFPNLFEWLHAKDGFPMLCEFLTSYDIPADFKKSLKGRAPRTSSTTAVIEATRGNVEHEILEAINSGMIGFRGGYVSSYYLNELFKNLRATHKIPVNKRKELMQSIGYVWHEGLVEGRLNNPVKPDNMKSVIYIHKDHNDRHLRSPKQIAEAYTAAQFVEE